jgi:hypothetical protein
MFLEETSVKHQASKTLFLDAYCYDFGRPTHCDRLIYPRLQEINDQDEAMSATSNACLFCNRSFSWFSSWLGVRDTGYRPGKCRHARFFYKTIRHPAICHHH